MNDNNTVNISHRVYIIYNLKRMLKRINYSMEQLKDIDHQTLYKM